MAFDHIPDEIDPETIERALAKLEARRVRMQEANEILAKWGPLSGAPALLALGLNNETIRKIAPRSGPVGFRPQEIAAVEGAASRLRSQLRTRRIALRQFVTRGNSSAAESDLGGCENALEARH